MPLSQEIQDNIITLLERCEFKKLCDDYFAPNFHWTIKGSSILSGTYTNKDAFFEKVIGRLNKVLSSTWKMIILDTYLAGNVFIVEMRGEVKAKDGADYNNEYCWIFKFKENKVISLTAYYDSLLVNNTLKNNEI